MSHIEAYRLSHIVDDENLLSKEINKALAEGWELHGPTQIVFEKYREEHGREIVEVHFYQALVKLRGEERKP